MQEPVVVENQNLDPRLEELVRSGVHFGYAKTRRHPRMRNFIAGVKSNIEIFYVEKVSERLQQALEYIEQIGKENGVILWVGTKPAASEYISALALELGHPYVNTRWVGGTLTNYKIIKERIAYWQSLLLKQKSGELAKYTKQEQLQIQREIDRLTRSFDGLVTLTGVPRALFIVDTNEESSAVREARLKKIPMIALLNTDCDPADVLFPIPGNDNSPKSISFILGKAKEAYLKGRENAGN